jgi:hypothetical protein
MKELNGQTAEVRQAEDLDVLAKLVARDLKKDRSDQLAVAKRVAERVARARVQAKHGEWGAWCEKATLSQQRAWQFNEFWKSLVTSDFKSKSEEEQWNEWQRISGNKPNDGKGKNTPAPAATPTPQPPPPRPESAEEGGGDDDEEKGETGNAENKDERDGKPAPTGGGGDRQGHTVTSPKGPAPTPPKQIPSVEKFCQRMHLSIDKTLSEGSPSWAGLNELIKFRENVDPVALGQVAQALKELADRCIAIREMLIGEKLLPVEE